MNLRCCGCCDTRNTSNSPSFIVWAVTLSVVDRPAQAYAQAVLTQQVVHHLVEDLPVLARIGALVDPAHLLRSGRQLAQ